MEGDCNVYAHSSLWMRPTRPDRYNAKMVYCSAPNPAWSRQCENGLLFCHFESELLKVISALVRLIVTIVNIPHSRNFMVRCLLVISIQIKNVYECNGTNIFMGWKMKCSIQRGEAELNGTFLLSPNENICSIARMRKHSLFVLYNLYKDSNS